jgi:hypothetical protein
VDFELTQERDRFEPIGLPVQAQLRSIAGHEAQSEAMAAPCRRGERHR